MIEVLVLDHLKTVLKVPVSLERLAEMKPPFVLLEKTSGGLRNQLESATFAFQSYHSSLYGAADLNVKVKEAVLSLLELPEIGFVRLNSDYNFTDTETKEYRYQAVFDIGF